MFQPASQPLHLIVLDSNGILYFAGWDYNYFTTDAAPAATLVFKKFQPFTLDTLGETIVDIFEHGVDGTYRLYALSSDQKLYCIGDNTNGVAQGGYNPAVPAIVRSLQKIPL